MDGGCSYRGGLEPGGMSKTPGGEWEGGREAPPRGGLLLSDAEISSPSAISDQTETFGPRSPRRSRESMPGTICENDYSAIGILTSTPLDDPSALPGPTLSRRQTQTLKPPLAEDHYRRARSEGRS